MELALNLCWSLLLVLLCGACVVARRRGQLHVCFAAALTCAVLLAVVLFPAISMTDDLQCVNLEAEARLRAMGAMIAASPAEPEKLVPALMFAVLLVALLAMLVRLLARLAMVRSHQNRHPWCVLSYRPAGPRPPTVLAFA